MSGAPRRMSDAEPDASPDAKLLRDLIRAHRNGRPDDAKMDELATLVGPHLTPKAAAISHVPSWLGPAVLSALLAAAAGWGAWKADDDVPAEPAASEARSEGPRAKLREATPTEAEAPLAETDPGAARAMPVLSVDALPNLDVALPAAASPRVSADAPRRGTKSNVAAAGDSAACDDVELIERAGAELRSGQAARALSTTRKHEVRCGEGLLAQERERIAIEALAVLGRADEARARASSFEARYPSSPHVRRVRQVVGTSAE